MSELPIHTPVRTRQKPWVIAITGASGICYARRLIEILLGSIADIQLEIVASEAGLRVMREEELSPTAVGRLSLEQLIGKPYALGEEQIVTIHSNRNIGATIASGSYRTEGMIVVPCSMRTLAAISNGSADNLIQRAADVCLKEKSRLIIVPRETPLSAIHLRHLLRLAKLDVRIVPAMPGFYNRPASIDELVDGFVHRLIDQMGIELPHAKRWGDQSEEERRKLSRV